MTNTCPQPRRRLGGRREPGLHVSVAVKSARFNERYPVHPYGKPALKALEDAEYPMFLVADGLLLAWGIRDAAGWL